MKERDKLLLHICCAGCGIFISNELKKEFDVVLYYCNPNLFPEDEYIKRLEEAKRVAHEHNLELISSGYNHENWLQYIKGHESDLEKGERCKLCYRLRLEQTAQKAKELNFDFFTTTLTVSPHKLAEEIINIGKQLAAKYELNFLDRDFKKNDGFKKASILSRELNLYRQNYCGCEFSRR
jgi:epoxyqueuosine reductase